MEENTTRHGIAAALFVMLFFSYCYFLQQPWNWNSVPRVALAVSIIENGTLTIDKFMYSTGDIAFYNGRFYTDKAPGMTLMALPVVTAARFYLRSNYRSVSWINFDGGVTGYFIFLENWANIFTSALITALAALALYYLALRLGMGTGGAVFGALSYGLATPAWGWATAFYGHGAAGGCLIIGLTTVYFLFASRENERRDVFLGFTAGALLSWAVVIELTSAPASVVIALYGLVSVRRWERRRLARTLLAGTAGALIFISPLLIYNYSITGSVTGSLYNYTQNFPGMTKGFYGLTYPHPRVLVKILFSGGHGLFWLSPLLLSSPYAIYRLWKSPGRKALAITLAAVPVYYLLMNSSYVYWTGGGSTGPRFLTPALPFLCLPLAMLWTGAGKYARALLLVLFTLSFLISLVCVSVSMTHALDWNKNLLTEYLIPGFIAGDKLRISLLVRWLVPNSLREGFTGQTALLPLYAVLLLCGGYIVWRLRKPGASL
jgi:hypothetical protein